MTSANGTTTTTAAAATTTTTASTTTSSDDEQSLVLSGCSSVILSLLSAAAGFSTNPDERKAKIAFVVGKLKIMDKAIANMDASPTLKSIQLMSDMAELAVKCLPQDTMKALEASESGSDIAMELLRRNLTQLPILTKTLYNATPDALDADAGLQVLHAQLASDLELYGALVAHGINPRKRSWARRLTERFSSLSELKRVSWRRLMHLVGMNVVLGLEDAADEGTEEDEVVHSLLSFNTVERMYDKIFAMFSIICS